MRKPQKRENMEGYVTKTLKVINTNKVEDMSFWTLTISLLRKTPFGHNYINCLFPFSVN